MRLVDSTDKCTFIQLLAEPNPDGTSIWALDNKGNVWFLDGPIWQRVWVKISAKRKEERT